MIYTVSEINNEVRKLIDQAPQFRQIVVRGEISNLVKHRNGNCYLTLKDSRSRLSAVIFANAVRFLPANLQEGMMVSAAGELSVFPMNGSYQLNIRHLSLDGVGLLYQQFLKLKEQLRSEGLFERKLGIPRYPAKIALVTSAEGAAYHDLSSTIARRWPVAITKLFPTLVQGPSAPKAIIAALAAAVQWSPCVIIVARGGGSYEDLVAFNDEELARYVATIGIPVVSGVGHESDETLIDFVSSLRAPTPTGAAELVTPQLSQVRRQLLLWDNALTLTMRRVLEQRRQKVAYYRDHYLLKSVDALVNSVRAKLDWQALSLASLGVRILELQRRRLGTIDVRAALARRYQAERRRLDDLALRLAPYDSKLILSQGYALVTLGEQLVTNSGQLKKGNEVNLRLSTGGAVAIIKEVDYDV